MSLVQISKQNGDLDLTGVPTVLAATTPSAGTNLLCRLLAEIGDAGNPLQSGSTGNLTLTVTVNGQELIPNVTAQYSSSATRVALETEPFSVPAGADVSATLNSDNGSDTSVDVTAYLFEQVMEDTLHATVTNTNITPTTTQFDVDDITEATPDHFVGRMFQFRTGALAGQQRPIIDYEQANGIGRFTTTPFTEAPANDDEGIIKL